LSEEEAVSYLLRPGDLLFARQSLVLSGAGKCSVFMGASEPVTFEGHLIRARINEEFANPLFYYYFFKSQIGRNAIESIVEQVAAAGIRGSDLTKLRVPLPSLEEQHTIAHILGTLDDKIELNRKMNETLEAMARALFKSWFVDFDPVRAKSEGRDTGLPAHIADLFPDSFEDSASGEIPRGWKVTPVSELVEYNSRTLGKNDKLDPIEYVEISSVMRGNISEILEFPRGTEPSRARRRLRHGDTVMSTVRPDRRAYFLCLNPSPSLIASTGFVVISPLKAPWSFIHAALTQSEVFDHLGLQADGGAYPAVSPEIIAGWLVPQPDQSHVLEEFHRVCCPLFERAAQNRIESLTLASIRDALLPKLLSGETRVKDTEKFVEEKI